MVVLLGPLNQDVDTPETHPLTESASPMRDQFVMLDSITSSSAVTPQKRPRPVKSCLNCRLKKLKCDREQPCAQCIRRKCAEECDYDENAGSLGTVGIINSTATSCNYTALTPLAKRQATEPVVDSMIVNEELKDEVRELEARVVRLEAMISGLEGKKAAIVHNGLLDNNTNTVNSSLQSSSNTKSTKYYGLSNTRSLAQLFPDVGVFIRTVLNEPYMKPEWELLNRNFPKPKITRLTSSSSTSSPPRMSDIDTMLGLLPPPEICERLVDVYDNYFPKVYQILHMPSFRQQCERFWGSTNNDNSEFTPLLALVVAFGARHDNNTSFTIDYRKICALADSYITNLELKKRQTPTAIQTSVLLILSMKILCAPAAQLWQYSGELVRLALTVGLHKEIEDLGCGVDMGNMQRELRRRVWYIIANLDVELSMDCCMPSLIQVTPWSCMVPDGGEEGDEEGIWQTAHARLLPLNLRALEILSKSARGADPAEIRQTLFELETGRTSLPQQRRYFSCSTTESSQSLYNAMMLDLCFRRVSLSLTTLGLQIPGFLESKDDTSRCLALCMGVISHSESLLDDDEDSELWKVFHAFNSDHLIRAAHAVCFCLRLLNPSEAHISPSLKPAQFFELDIPAATIRRTVDDFVRLCISRKPDLRLLLKQIIALCLASESTKIYKSQAKRTEAMKTRMRTCLDMCRERHAADVRMSMVYADSTGTRGSMDSGSDLGSFGGGSNGAWDQYAWGDFEFDVNALNWNMVLFTDS